MFFMKKYFILFILCLCICFPMTAYADNIDTMTIVIDGVAQTSEDIRDLGINAYNMALYALGYVVDKNYEFAQTVLDTLDFSGFAFNMTSSDDGYIVDKSTYDNLNIMLTQYGYNGVYVRGQLGVPSQCPAYSGATRVPIYIQYSPTSSTRYSAILVSGTPFFSGSSGISINGGREIYIYYTTGGSFMQYPFAPYSDYAVNIISRNGNLYTSDGYSSFFVPRNNDTLANNSLSPSVSTPFTFNEYNHIDYNTWIDNKVGTPYEDIQAPVPVVPTPTPTPVPYNPSDVFLDVNNDINNINNNGFTHYVFDNSGMSFITSCFYALPFTMQNIIFIGLTLTCVTLLIGTVSYIAKRR